MSAKSPEQLIPHMFLLPDLSYSALENTILNQLTEVFLHFQLFIDATKIITNLWSQQHQMGGERRPGIDCLCMRDHSQESVYIWRLGGMRHTEMC